MTRARTTPLRTGSRTRAVYERAHVGWRCGAVDDFYYGRRSPSDPTVVWYIDEVEYDVKDLVGVGAAIDVALIRAGIVEASFGSAWCGYRSLLVTYADGSCLTERYDSTVGRVVREYATAEEVAA